MAHYRKLRLLLCIFVSLSAFKGPVCYSQNRAQRQAYPPTLSNQPSGASAFSSQQLANQPRTQWTQPPLQIDDRPPISNPNAKAVSIYDPTRIESARRSAVQYRTMYSESPLLVSELAATNASLADQWAELATTINSVLVRLSNANAKLEAATGDYEEVETSLLQHGLTPTIGLLLSHKRSQLEDWQVDSSTDQEASDELKRWRQTQLENELIAYDGSDIPGQTAKILAASGYEPNRIENSLLNSQVQSLLSERRGWLRLLSQGYEDYRQKLGELDSASAAFEKLTDDYRELINRSVTWIRSHDPLGIADLQNLSTGIDSLFDARRSSDFGYSLNQKWRQNPVGCMTALGTVLLVLLLRGLAKACLIGLGKRTRMRESTANVRKCLASLLTPLVAVAFPGILYLIARWLGSGYVTESTLHVADGLYAASFVALMIEVPRQLLRANGFVERHLKTELPRRQRASAYLLLIGTGLILAAYLFTLAAHIDHGVWSGSVARIGFIAALLIVAWTAHLSLKPNGGFLAPLIEGFGGNVLYRIRLVYYIAAVGFPLLMIALIVLGYQFTAMELIKRTGFTFVSILAGATLWSAVKILSAATWDTLTGVGGGQRGGIDSEGQESRISGALAEQSLELKHQIGFLGQCSLALAATVCLGWLWVDILPNVRMGNPVLWSVQENVTQSFTDANGQEVSRTAVAQTSITALHLVIAGAIMFVAFQLAKLLPSIFDVLVLQRVSFDEAMEHLSLVLGRCLLFGTGTFIAGRLIGVRWEAIQWLAVGLTIGLGFGLQDLVRNLFGGFVVLFEKPAKLGDLITVGHVTGRVAAQKLRTTVISDEEGRTVIVPNKNFVSQDVINWMGVGRVKLISIEVAVTREQRPADVCRMLQQLIVEQPNILLSPSPQATLVCVSQKSQRIELRGWIEEDKDVLRHRETLMDLVLTFLAEKNILAPIQPRQRSLNESFTAEPRGDRRSRPKRSA